MFSYRTIDFLSHRNHCIVDKIIKLDRKRPENFDSNYLILQDLGEGGGVAVFTKCCMDNQCFSHASMSVRYIFVTSRKHSAAAILLRTKQAGT